MGQERAGEVMGCDVWIREDGVEMLGQWTPRRPGAHICTCWYYDVRKDPWEAMCGAERGWHLPEYEKFQILGLGHLPKPDDCEKCRVLFVKGVLEGRIYHHSIHEVTKHALEKERNRKAKIAALRLEIARLENGGDNIERYYRE